MMRRADSLGKTLMLGKIWAGEGDNRIRWLDGVTDSIHMTLSKFRDIAKDRAAWHVAVHGVTKNRT